MSTRAKAGILSLLACILFAIFSLQLMKPPAALPPSVPQEVFSAGRAWNHLAVIAKQPHSVGTPENDKVIEYLSVQLRNLGLEVSIQDTLVSKVDNRRQATRISSVKNIIGRLKGTDNSMGVMLMSHHDSQPNTPGAADDGSGVAAILETLRAIKAQGPLKNDLYVLFTDAEEIGLMGAKAFVDYHPLLKDIGVLLNLEARGNKGISISFELNPENGWMVNQFAQSAPYPFANSMGYEVYKILPNDSDFSNFRSTHVAGVNSACIEGFVNYHSMTDHPDHISKHLVQHHGANMLGMVQHLGNLDIKETKSPDAVFFNPIGSSLIVIPPALNKFFILLAIGLYILTVVLGIRQNQVIMTHLMTGIGFFLVAVTVSGIGSILLQQAIVSLHPHFTMFYANNFYNVGYYFISFVGVAALFYAIVFGIQPELSGLSLSLGGILMLIMSMLGLTISLPTASYMLYYPIIWYLLVQLVLLYVNFNAENEPIAYGIGQFFALAPGIALWVPMMYLLFVTFGLTQAVVAPVIIFCFLGILMIPIIRMISLWKKRILNTLAVLTILVGVVAGYTNADYSKEQPLQAHLMYGFDADYNNAVWVTNKQYKNEWLRTLIPDNPLRPFNEIYPELGYQIWRANAPNTTVSPSDVKVLSDTLVNENQRLIELNIQFPSFVNSMEFFLEDRTKISNIKINDFEVTGMPRREDDRIYLNFFAPPQEGFKLSFLTKSELQKLRIVDRIIGLPENLFPSPMPKDMIHGPGYRSNVTLVKKSYEF